MHPWVQKMVRHVQSTPPSCLSGFRVTPAHAGPWNDWAAWALTCACGSSRGKLLGHPFNNGRGNESLFVSPLAFQCSSCGKTTEIIDTKRHGYNAEIDKIEGKSYDSNARGTGERQAVPCPSCGGLDFSLTALCAHSHFDLIEDQPELGLSLRSFSIPLFAAGSAGPVVRNRILLASSWRESSWVHFGRPTTKGSLVGALEAELGAGVIFQPAVLALRVWSAGP